LARLQIYQFACLSDNYGVLVHDPASGATASIDAPDEGPILRVLDETGWRLTDIWVTHKHHDHVGGVAGLKARFGLRVIGPRSEADQIPGLDVPVQEGDRLAFTQNCMYPDGARVFCAAFIEFGGRQIVRQTIVQAWDG